MTLVMIIQRFFYKNLFTDEGYLMFSLARQNLGNWYYPRLLVGLMWTLVCTVIIFYNIFYIFHWALFSMMELTQTIQTAYTDFAATFGSSLNLLIFELILSSIVGVISSILMIYVSIAIGQLFSQHRIIASFGAYIGITIAIQIIVFNYYVRFYDAQHQYGDQPKPGNHAIFPRVSQCHYPIQCYFKYRFFISQRNIS